MSRGRVDLTLNVSRDLQVKISLGKLELGRSQRPRNTEATAELASNM